MRYGSYSTDRASDSMLSLTGDPIHITPNTWLEFKIDEMSVTGPTDPQHQAMVLWFNDNLILQLSQTGQTAIYGATASNWVFTIGATFRLNINQLFETYSTPLPAPAYLNFISFYQVIWNYHTPPPGVDYEQRMKVDYVRIVEELIAVPGVIGMTQADAEALIQGSDLQVGTVTVVSSALPAGQVVSQTPASGICVPYDTEVDLEVSSGV